MKKRLCAVLLVLLMTLGMVSTAWAKPKDPVIPAPATPAPATIVIDLPTLPLE